MKELFSAFGSEVFRPMVTLLVPGGIALSAWYVAVLQRFSEIYALVSANHTETAFVLVGAMLFVGLILEDLGSAIEVCVFDRQLDDSTHGLHGEDWFRYLRLAFRVEPIGQRYLKTLVLRMKFEIGTCIAFVIAGVGLFATELVPSWASLSALTLLGASALLFREAGKSHRCLSRLREELLKGITVVDGLP